MDRGLNLEFSKYESVSATDSITTFGPIGDALMVGQCNCPLRCVTSPFLFIYDSYVVLYIQFR
jgi:hypothetical protein